ncbi:MAG: mandelate racemase/muconate lactonizing enzyme family protein [Chloroflexota bacterium]|nr:MAG: mandelate racemase/muconate lactonizing enzyme family protein [Chloroflexota bacterium]
MKIRDVRTVHFSMGYKNCLVVLVETDDGLTGIGEVGIAHLEAARGAVEALRPRLIGQDATRIEHLWQFCFRGSFFPGGNILSAAISGIDIALWDLNAKALGVPVHRLLGGLCRDRVPTYCHIGGHTLDGVVESARERVAEGWKYIRWGMPQQGERHEPTVAVRESIHGMEMLRTALGDEVEICFDVHARLDPSDAITLAKGIEPVRPFFLEDPIRSENVQLLRHVRQHVNVPLAIGEHYASKWEFRQVVEEDLTDFARIDLCIVGGLTEARKVAGWAETHQIRLATHNPLGPISGAACMHLSATITNQGVAEQIRQPGTTVADIFPLQTEWRDGYLIPSDRPGLGVAFDEKAALANPARAPGAGRMLVRDDGSLTNW